jgi:hypothetical protein
VIYREPKTHIPVGNLELPKRGCYGIGDQVTILSGNPCFEGQWGDVVRVEETWNIYETFKEYQGKNGTIGIYNDRFQRLVYTNLTTGLTAQCYGVQLLDASI